MSLHDTVTIVCDRCLRERVGQVGQAPSELRAVLREDGWAMSFDREDGEDRCDNCADRR